MGENEEWRSCYFHPQRRVFLMVYVDDFKMAEPTEQLPICWKELREDIDLSGPQMRPTT